MLDNNKLLFKKVFQKSLMMQENTNVAIVLNGKGCA